MKIKISELETKLGYKINTNIQSIGLDIAERTGVCFISTNEKYAEFDWQFIEFDKSNIEYVYKQMHKEFSKIITKEKNKDNIVIIEDTFLQRFGKFVQADVFKKLTRFGTLALSACFNKEIEHRFILAKSSRSKLKIKMITGKPKESVAEYLFQQFNIELDDDDISDSIVLAILGICEDMDYRTLKEIAKAKKELKSRKRVVKKSVTKVSRKKSTVIKKAVKKYAK